MAKNRNVRASLSPGGIDWHIVVSCRVIKGATDHTKQFFKRCSIHPYEDQAGMELLKSYILNMYTQVRSTLAKCTMQAT